MKTALIVLLIIIIIYILLSYILFLLVSRKMPIVSKILDKKAGIEIDKYKDKIIDNLEWINNIEYKDIYIRNRDNLLLHGIYIDNPKSKKILVLLHGYRSTPNRDVYPSVKDYYDLNYSILIIDQRACGKSQGKYITFGYKEKKDVIVWLKYLNKHYNKPIVLAGISMGATTALLVPEIYNKNIIAIYTDSGYISGYEEVKYTLKHYFYIPSSLFMPTINFCCKIFAKYNLKDINTLKSLKNIRIPILFAHGDIDDFIPAKNSLLNYKKYQGPKKLLIIKNANHGMGYLVNKEKYLKVVKEIDKEVDKIVKNSL